MKNQYKNIDFLFCSFTPVGLEDYVKYFIKNFSGFTYLKWKFPHTKGKNTKSAYEKYQDGKIIDKKNIFSPAIANKSLYFLFLPLTHFVYLLQALKYGLRKDKNKIRVFMGINYFCGFCGIILKRLGQVDHVIYRVMDFFPIPRRGIYRYLNRIFHSFDKYCLAHSDAIWFTTEGHLEGREKYGYFDRKKQPYQLIPLAIDLGKFVQKECKKQNIIYCGVISKYHMFDLIFASILELRKKFPDIHLKIIGSGPDKEYFEKLTKEKKLEDNVTFYGFVEEGEEFAKLMTDNVLGIALYRDEEDFMRYTEPAKLKYYLGFGVPVVVSDVPKIAREIDREKIGFCVKNDKNIIVKTIANYLSDKKKQKQYRENIKKYIKSIDVTYLLDKNFKETFDRLNTNQGLYE